MAKMLKGIGVESLFCVGDIFSVTVGGKLFDYFEFDNYRDAEKKYKELKGAGECTVQLVLHRILKTEETNNGNDDE